jgi:type II secretion system protein J
VAEAFEMRGSATGCLGRRGGFTLMEFLVAMAMFAIIMPALTIAFRTSLNAGERIDRRSVGTSEARAVMAIVTEDLKNAYMPSTTGAGWLIGTDSSSGSAPADSLSLTTMSGRASIMTLSQGLTPADTDQPMSVFQQVNYSLVPGLQSNSSILVRAFASPPGTDSTATTDETQLSDRVTGLNFEYFDGTTWNDTWDTTQPQTTTGTDANAAQTTTPPLPLAIRVTIGFATPDGQQTYTTTVPLPMYNASTQKIEAETIPPAGGAPGGATTGTTTGTTSGSTGGTTAGGATTAGGTTGTTTGR